MKVKSVVVMAAVGCLVLVAIGLADQDRRVKLASTKAYSIDNSDFREVMSKARHIAETDGVPGIPEARMVVHSMEKGVVYLDEAGGVLRSRRAERFEWCAVSADGGILAFMGESTVRFPGSLSSERELTWLRVERATGELVWERKDGFGMEEIALARFLVTNQGYVVVSANAQPSYYTFADGKITRPLIFDSNGDLVAQLPAPFYRGWMSVSRDGAYCAINFADLDAESPARCSGGQESAKQCLALFEVNSGRELWRHYFAHCESGSVALTEGAERVICGVTEAEWVQANQRYLGTYSLYVFDRQGKMISRVETRGPLRALVLSPNERVASVAVIGSGTDDILTIDPLDGRVVGEWSCEPSCNAYVFSVSDSASTCVEVLTSHPSEEISRAYHWTLIDPKGMAIYEEPYREDNPPYVLLSADGRTLRKIWKGGFEQYALDK